MRLIGHRGAPSEMPENTLASFDAALAAGADGIESDIRLTADAQLVVCHDDLVPSGRISEMTLSDLRAAGPYPTAGEVLERYGGRTDLYLECKGIFEKERFASAEPAARALAPMLAGVGRVTVSSFDPSAVAALASAGVDARLAIGCAEMFDPFAVVEAAAIAGYAEVHPSDLKVTPELCEHAGRAGVGLVVWTVNDPSRALELRAMGVAGIFSDDPRAMRSAGV